jgi:RecB family exonuclease
MRDLSRGAVPGFRSVSLENPAPASDEVAVDDGEIRLRLVAGDSGSARDALKALAQIEPHRLNRPLAYDRARWERRLTEFDGRLQDPALVRWAATKMGASAGQVSASRLEEYAKCPYLFFLKRVMDLEAWEEPMQTEGMDPLERGVAVHSILESFLRNFCGEKFLGASVDDLWRFLESGARDSLEKSRPAGMPDLLWEIERDNLLAMLREWLAFEKDRASEGLLPAQLERAFGELSPEERGPAFCLKAGKHVFEIRGRIDRVDISDNGKRARVIDYKTGALPDSMHSKSRTLLMSGEKIQLAVYRGALSVLEVFECVETVEGEYLHLQPGNRRIVACSYNAEELLEASEQLPHTLEIIGDGIERGVFFARTRGAVRPWGHCEYCDYLPICGKDRIQREERKANDPAVHDFLKMLETPR